MIIRVKAGDVFIGNEVNISEGNEFHMNGQPFSIGTEDHKVDKTYAMSGECDRICIV